MSGKKKEPDDRKRRTKRHRSKDKKSQKKQTKSRQRHSCDDNDDDGGVERGDDDDDNNDEVNRKPTARASHKRKRSPDHISNPKPDLQQQQQHAALPSPPGRPPPPPRPPAALIKLLQSNRSVLRYFTALQANLEADVAIWKHRASHWQDQYNQIRQQQQHQPHSEHRTTANGNPSPSDVVALRDNSLAEPPISCDSKDHTNLDDGVAVSDAVDLGTDSNPQRNDESFQAAEATTIVNDQDGQSIQDDMFLLSSSSSEDDEDEDGKHPLREENDANGGVVTTQGAVFEDSTFENQANSSTRHHQQQQKTDSSFASVAMFSILPQSSEGPTTGGAKLQDKDDQRSYCNQEKNGDTDTAAIDLPSKAHASHHHANTDSNIHDWDLSSSSESDHERPNTNTTRNNDDDHNSGATPRGTNDAVVAASDLNGQRGQEVFINSLQDKDNGDQQLDEELDDTFLPHRDDRKRRRRVAVRRPPVTRAKPDASSSCSSSLCSSSFSDSSSSSSSVSSDDLSMSSSSSSNSDSQSSDVSVSSSFAESQHQRAEDCTNSEIFQLLRMAYLSLEKFGIELVISKTLNASAAVAEITEQNIDHSPFQSAMQLADPLDTTTIKEIDPVHEAAMHVEPAESTNIIEEGSYRLDDTEASRDAEKNHTASYLEVVPNEVVVNKIYSVIKGWARTPDRVFDQSNADSDNHSDNHHGTTNHLDDNDDRPCPNAGSSGNDHHRNMLRALLILDSFCSPMLSVEVWESYFHCMNGVYEDDRLTVHDSIDVGHKQEAICKEDMLRMQLALRGRQSLVQELLQSIQHDIIYQWPSRDLSDRWLSSQCKMQVEPIVEELGVSSPVDDNDDGNVSCATNANQPQLHKVVRMNPSSMFVSRERSIHAQLLTGLHLSRNDLDHAAHLVLNYIQATAPALSAEDYPAWPPLLSFVLLERLLQPDPAIEWLDDISNHWFRDWMIANGRGESDSVMDPSSAFSLILQVTGSIWKDRVSSDNEAISSVAASETDAYNRLLSTQSDWIFPHDPLFIDHVRTTKAAPQKEACLVLIKQLPRAERALGSWGLLVYLIMIGDVKFIWDVFQQLQAAILSRPGEIRASRPYFLLATIQAFRELYIRSLEQLRHHIGLQPPNEDGCYSSFTRILPLFLTSIQDWPESDRVRALEIFLEISAELGSGSVALQAVELFMPIQENINADCPALEAMWNIIDVVARLPIVRVINLERRQDRMDAFACQALKEKLLFVKAVAIQDDCATLGDYAFDGSGRMAEAHARLAKVIGSTAALDKLVAAQWRPNDVKAFDRDAPSDERLVFMTMTERACALSHIYSWKGVNRSLHELPTEVSAGTNVFQNPDHLLRLYPGHVPRRFKISGFAQGPALLAENVSMPPSPVCVVFEDDAVLVDQFRRRLDEILQELPRDFHFCSLGYSRPKSAPIVTFGRQIGIPTMVWYLTGYIVSMQGTQYLLDRLPVVGPVDTWIGLQMTANWDNVHGTAIGLGGRVQKPHVDLPCSRHELRQILKFRAFCALKALCSQRVGSAMEQTRGHMGNTLPANGLPGGVLFVPSRSWRQRDTDIDYSGSQTNMNRIRNR